MSEKMMKKSRVLLAALFGMVAIAALTLWGCGGSSYDNPATGVTTTKTATALVSPADLKQWMDQGLVNKQGGYDRVVVLEVSSKPLNYASEHIPGAIFVNLSELTATRVEGPAEFGSMVATGAQMDALIKKAGIDENTTIVFTTSSGEMNSNALWYLTRGYTTFRYWGFPKERLKVLDGGNLAWVAAAGTMTSAVPAITTSSYGIAPNGANRVRQELRASLSEMMDAVTANSKDFIDGRGSIAGGTTDLIVTATPVPFVVFEGRLSGTNSRILPYTNLVDATTKQFKSVLDVQTLLDIKSDTAYTLCRAGNIASVLFFAVDGYAYSDGTKKAVWYDGSWGQWGLMADLNNGGKLPAGSAWSTIALTSGYSDNATAGRTVVDISNRLLSPHPAFPANPIEEADKAYLSPLVPTSGGSSGGGGGC
uniref:Rhodanese domain protein n=1 Tax=Geobacter sp. (strain M21) TaxID=443144 RepID=C6E9N8_GEOSM